MSVTTPYSARLRFVDAGKLDDSDIKIDHLPVYGWGHEKLGHLDGFIVDTATDGVSYAVVHAGGWLSSKRFLLPIGHIDRLDPQKKELMTDISKDAIRLFPAFDKERFLELSDTELREFERQTAAACCPAEVIVEGAVWIHDTLPHYRQPSWWQPEYGVPATTTSGSEARQRR